MLYFSKDPNGYQDVLVMDEDRIILFDSEGNIKDELMDSQIRKFRGLSHVTLEDGKINLVTTEKTRHALKIVFIDLENLCNGVVRKMGHVKVEVTEAKKGQLRIKTIIQA